MEKTTPAMDDATGTVIKTAPTLYDVVHDLARMANVDPDEAASYTALARATDANSDSAFGIKYCDVTSPHDLDFDGAAAAWSARFPNFSESEARLFAVADAAEGLHGMLVEKALVDHFDFLSPAPRSEESNGHDAVADSGAWVSVKRNDRTKARHGARKGWGDDETILLSWGIQDGDVIVAFEDGTGETMGHGVVRGK